MSYSILTNTCNTIPHVPRDTGAGEGADGVHTDTQCGVAVINPHGALINIWWTQCA